VLPRQRCVGRLRDEDRRHRQVDGRAIEVRPFPVACYAMSGAPPAVAPCKAATVVPPVAVQGRLLPFVAWDIVEHRQE
jgi:hypothetical protein